MEDIKIHVKNAIMNIFHENIDVHSIRLVAEVPGGRVKFITKLQSHSAIIIFFYK